MMPISSPTTPTSALTDTLAVNSGTHSEKIFDKYVKYLVADNFDKSKLHKFNFVPGESVDLKNDDDNKEFSHSLDFNKEIMAEDLLIRSLP